MARHSTGFFDLPRELRNEVYQHFFAKSYKLPPDYLTCHWLTPRPCRSKELLQFPIKVESWNTRSHDENPAAPGDEAIFRVLPEAVDWMFKHTKFCFTNSCSCCGSCYLSTSKPPTQHIASRIQDLDFVLNLRRHNDFCSHGVSYNGNADDYMHELSTSVAKNPYDKQYQVALELFSGPACKRRSMRAVFEDGTYADPYEIATTALFKAMALMTGFETVTVTLGCELSGTRRGLPLCGPSIESCLKHDHCAENKYEFWDSTREFLQHRLEPTLGPGRGFERDDDICMEFQPQRHQNNLQNGDRVANTEIVPIRPASIQLKTGQ